MGVWLGNTHPEHRNSTTRWCVRKLRCWMIIKVLLEDKGCQVKWILNQLTNQRMFSNAKTAAGRSAGRRAGCIKDTYSLDTNPNTFSFCHTPFALSDADPFPEAFFFLQVKQNCLENSVLHCSVLPFHRGRVCDAFHITLWMRAWACINAEEWIL